MSSKIEYLIQDMKKLPKTIPLSKVDELCDELKTKETIKYLQSLKKGSKPETALRESFFAGEPILKDMLGELIPEASVTKGFIDYKIEDKIGRVILLELKSYYTVDKGKLKEEELSWKDHKHQIFKYMSEKYRYVILTDLKEWYFFSNKQCVTEEQTKPLDKDSTQFNKFYEELKKEVSLWDYLQFKELRTEKSKLDERFLDSLKIWEKKLSDLKFNVSDEEKTNVIIHLINKFIFIQTLEDFRAIGRVNWLYNEWREKDEKWKPRGKNIVVKKFLNEIDEFFYTYYDTELFKTNILEKIDSSKTNMDELYEKLKFVLGLNDYQRTFLGENSGIMQYDFVSIDEDILGKAYEGFLAEIRKEEGIYYTPKYITQYIAENTVGQQYDRLLEEIEKKLENLDFEKCEKLIEKFVTISVLDPACGSGSFLIKTLRIIWKKYEELGGLLNNVEKVLKEKNLQVTNTEDFSHGEVDKRIQNFRKVVGLDLHKRELISKIVLRHIHGNDKDKNALEVAKINIWLEAIKLAPEEFRHKSLPNVEHILPDLEMNLGNGDSLVGLPEDQTIKFLKDNHEKELETLFKLREQYLKDPTIEGLVEEIKTIKNNLRKEIKKEFKKYLEENNLPSVIFKKTKPFYWVLDFWYVLFDENLEVKPKEQQGFDVVIGNPPWGADIDDFVKYFESEFPNSNKEHKDSFKVFIDKAILLTTGNGFQSFIVPSALLTQPRIKDIRTVMNNYFFHTVINLGEKVFGTDSEAPSCIYILSKKVEKNSNVRTLDLTHSRDNKYKARELSKKTSYGKVNQEVYSKTPHCSFITFYRPLRDNEDRLDNVLDCRDAGINYQRINVGMREKGKSDLADRLLYEGEKEDQQSKEYWKGEDMGRYYTKEKTNRFVRLNYKEFIKENEVVRIASEFYSVVPKILWRQTAWKLITTIDNRGLFFGRSIQGGILKNMYKNKLKISYIAALLNSKYLAYLYINSVGEVGRVYPQVKLSKIKELPIKIGDKEIQEDISTLINKIITLKKLQHNFREIWEEYSQKYRNNYKSFEEILNHDKINIQYGKFDDTWTTEVSIYPDDDNELLDEEFGKFRVIGENDKKLKIYGISDSKEYVLLEITTRDKELRDILYLGISELLDSQRKIKTLRNIFSKSEISVITPEIWKNSANLIEGTTRRFKEWLNEQNWDIEETDIIKIDKEIQEVDNLIDAHVFKLYELNRKEVETVLDSLNTLDSIKKDILEKYDSL